MTHSPDQFFSGTQYELRVTASDLELRQRLFGLTRLGAQSVLPPDIYLFSQQRFGVQDKPKDTQRDVDRTDITETQFRGLRMKVMQHARQSFSLDPSAERIDQSADHDRLRLQLQLRLGAQAASAVMAAPFFGQAQRESGLVAMRYDVPNPLEGEAFDAAVEQLEEYVTGLQIRSVNGLKLTVALKQERQLPSRSMIEMRTQPPTGNRQQITDDGDYELDDLLR